MHLSGERVSFRQYTALARAVGADRVVRLSALDRGWPGAAPAGRGGLRAEPLVRRLPPRRARPRGVRRAPRSRRRGGALRRGLRVGVRHLALARGGAVAGAASVEVRVLVPAPAARLLVGLGVGALRARVRAQPDAGATTSRRARGAGGRRARRRADPRRRGGSAPRARRASMTPVTSMLPRKMTPRTKSPHRRFTERGWSSYGLAVLRASRPFLKPSSPRGVSPRRQWPRSCSGGCDVFERVRDDPGACVAGAGGGGAGADAQPDSGERGLAAASLRAGAQGRAALLPLLDTLVEPFVREIGKRIAGGDQSPWTRTQGVLRVSPERGVRALYEEFSGAPPLPAGHGRGPRRRPARAIDRELRD